MTRLEDVFTHNNHPSWSWLQNHNTSISYNSYKGVKKGGKRGNKWISESSKSNNSSNNNVLLVNYSNTSNVSGSIGIGVGGGK